MSENRLFSFELKKYLHQKDIAKAHVSRLQMIYSENIPQKIQLPLEYNNWRFNIRVNATQKEQILRLLFEHNLYASSHYKSLAEDAEKNTPNAVKLQKEIINLFIDPQFYTEEQALETCRLINSIL